MLSLNVRTPVHENNHTSHRVQDPSLIRISQQCVYGTRMVSGTHPVGSGRGPSVAWAHTSHSPDVVTALDT